jgi:outer membrane receptor protein involved in Fe transport
LRSCGVWLGAFTLVTLITALPSAQTLSTTGPPPSAQRPDPIVVTVDVVGVTPLPGIELRPVQLPAPVQLADAAHIASSHAVDLSDFLNQRFASVHVNDLQGNPLQADLSYRGYTASPLLGTPQGLSLYLDGVRLNQPFGQVISWDLIPRLAMQDVALIPGSNPLFGLNTLGGSLSVRTKTGLSNPGASVSALLGGDWRRSVEGEYGGFRDDGLHWYVTGNYFEEGGWRASSPTEIWQGLGKVGKHTSRGQLDLTLTYADNSLVGNGLQSREFLDLDYSSIYTKPDITENRSTLINLTGSRQLNPRLSLSSNLYYRHLRTHTLNGDLNDESLDQALYQPTPAERAALEAAGYTGVPASGANAENTPFPYWRCVANVLLQDEPGETCNGLINRGATTQYSAGAAGQVRVQTQRGSRSNLLLVGGAFDRGGVDFVQSTELGYLNPDRSIAGTGAFADGVSGGDVDGEPLDTRVGLDGTVTTWSVFASDTFSPTTSLNLTVSGRYDRSRLSNRDRITPGGGAGSLDGDHLFARLNPAAGLTYSPTTELNVYAGYAEGSRAPASVELGCADPEHPCKLPNAMVGDPPLEQVVARTFEFGGRSDQAGWLRWNAGTFFTSTSDDILFVASEQTGFGYFKNFGSTRRQGFELGASARLGAVSLGASYTFLDATFRSEEVVNGSSNSSNDEAEDGRQGVEGVIAIEEGDRIPLIPRHMFKAYGNWRITSRLSADVDLVSTSGSYARGNENNLHEPDGVYYTSEGLTSGYAVTNVGLRFELLRWLEVVAEVRNLFGTAYSTASQLGTNGFTESGNFIARPFLPSAGEFPLRHTTFEAPGAPRRAFVSVRVTR